jgi:hypothetical protein
MYPPIYALVRDDPAVEALLGADPRVYPFGQAPQYPTLPYAVWQVIYGSPENYINDRPNIDSFGIQIDVYATTVNEVRNCAKAIRNAIELDSHVVSWRGEEKEGDDTQLYRLGFDAEFWTTR